jgi:hypothetical protein
LAGKLGEVFREHHPGVQLEIAAGGSVVGIQAIHEGTADIGMASRALKPDEAQGLNPFQIAIDVLAVIVHPSNPVDGLTLPQLQAVYGGKITNWRELGGSDQPIVVLVREKSSGTRGAFDEIVLAKQEPKAPGLKAVVTAGIWRPRVGDQGVGYVGFGNLEPTVKPVAIDRSNPPNKPPVMAPTNCAPPPADRPAHSALPRFLLILSSAPQVSNSQNRTAGSSSLKMLETHAKQAILVVEDDETCSKPRCATWNAKGIWPPLPRMDKPAEPARSQPFNLISSCDAT